MIGLKQMGGTETDLKPDELEYQLAHLSGAIKTDLERNPRQDREFKVDFTRRRSPFSNIFKSIP
tara:strand:+ start:1890 stop:2081 length:192 start_codon:yes stop_codon:yes gene_type:complete